METKKKLCHKKKDQQNLFDTFQVYPLVLFIFYVIALKLMLHQGHFFLAQSFFYYIN